MRRTTFVAVMCTCLMAAACSSEPEPTIYAGDKCSEAMFDHYKCGRTPDHIPAVLQCTQVVDYVWVVIAKCDYKCDAAACVAGDPDTEWLIPPKSDVTLDDSGNPPDGFKRGDRHRPEDVKPDEGGPSCEPGQIACHDDYTKKTCNIIGTDWELEPCPESEGCDQGYCMPQVCTPWELAGECVGPASYSRCAANGTKWEEGWCEAPNMCYMGTCEKHICPPDAVTCKGMTAIQECQMLENGEYGWVVTHECKGGICQEGECIGACEVNLKDNTYLGCDYWAVDLDNVEQGQYQPVAIVVSVPASEAKAAEITFTDMSKSPPALLTPQQLSVADMLVEPGQLEKFMLPSGFDLDGSVLTNKSVRIESTAPVTLHQFNPLNGNQVFTNDASLLLPSNVGSTEFIVMAWPQRTTGYTFRGFATVIATQEGTTKVDVWPTTQVLGGTNVQSMAKDPPAPYTFYMEIGDVLNLETDGQQGSDLTGTRIVSDQKVNVLAGHECANIPLGTNYCDHVEQQLFPVAAWGSHYIGDSFKPRNANQKDIWRIVAGANNVTINLNPVVAGPFVLNKAEWVEFSTPTSFEIVATGPVFVGHYLQGSNYPGFGVANCPNGMTGIGDPAFTLGVPTEQYLDEYIVLTPDAYVEDYINITAKMSAQGFIMLDGAVVTTPLVPVGASAYGVAQVPVADGVHTITANEPIGVTAYGYDCDVSYAYPGGLSLKTIQ